MHNALVLSQGVYITYGFIYTILYSTMALDDLTRVLRESLRSNNDAQYIAESNQP